MNFELLDSLPIRSVDLIIAIFMLACGEIGYRLGVRDLRGQDKEASASLGPMVGGLLGMLAFVLAITFSMSYAQHDLRRKNVLEEANSIGVAYLRADLIDQQYQSKVKRLLREYVDVRLQVATGEDLDASLARTVEIHHLLWAQVSTAARLRPDTNTALVIQSINNVIDMHERRLNWALRNRIPGGVWFSLFVITALTMITMGVQVGLTGRRRLVAVIPLILAFSVLATLVVELNRPQRQIIKVGQQSMLDLKKNIDHQRNKE